VFHLALSIVLLFALCEHFANKYMDGWMDGWMAAAGVRQRAVTARDTLTENLRDIART